MLIRKNEFGSFGEFAGFARQVSSFFYLLQIINITRFRYFFRVPHAHIIADYIWPGLIMSPERVIDIRKMKFERDDVLLCSYPKSGTTWMCELVSALAYGGDTEAVRKVRQDERCNWIEL